MADPNTYEDPWRPLHELWSIGIWGAAAVAAALISASVALPKPPFYMMLCFSLSMALIRTGSVWRLWWRRRGLSGAALSFIRPEDLQRKMRKRPDAIWLGYGFRWSQRFTQLAFDIMKRDPKGVLPAYKDTVHGSPWIHGLQRRDGDLFMPLEHQAGHSILIGTTGSGKTRTFDLLITQAVLRGEAVVIIDPKGDQDLLQVAQTACRLAGRSRDFLYFHPAFPERCVRLDPLYNWNRASEIANRIAALYPSDSGSAAFKSMGQMMLDKTAQALLFLSVRPSLRNLRDHIENGVDGLVIACLKKHLDQTLGEWRSDVASFLANAGGQGRKVAFNGQITAANLDKVCGFYRQRVRPEHPCAPLDAVLSIYDHDRDHYNKILASLFPILNNLTAGHMGELLSPDPTREDPRPISDLGTAIERGQVVFIGLDSLSDAIVGTQIGAILISELTSVAGQRYNYGSSNRVSVFVDEAAEVIKASEPFVQLLNKSRGAGFSLTIATQTFSDFAAVTGSEDVARQYLGNCNNLIALRTLDDKTQDYITDSLPETTVKYVMHTHANSTATENPMLFSGNVGQRLMEQQVPIFPKQLLRSLPNLEYVGVISGGRIVKGRVPILKVARPTEVAKPLWIGDQ